MCCLWDLEGRKEGSSLERVAKRWGSAAKILLGAPEHPWHMHRTSQSCSSFLQSRLAVGFSALDTQLLSLFWSVGNQRYQKSARGHFERGGSQPCLCKVSRGISWPPPGSGGGSSVEPCPAQGLTVCLEHPSALGVPPCRPVCCLGHLPT